MLDLVVLFLAKLKKFSVCLYVHVVLDIVQCELKLLTH